MIYVRLFHGRTHPAQELDGWGEDGPVLGPFNYYHSTYRNHVRFGLPDDHPASNVEEVWEPTFVDDQLHYDGMYYGDFSITTLDKYEIDQVIGSGNSVVEVDFTKTKFINDGNGNVIYPNKKD